MSIWVESERSSTQDKDSLGEGVGNEVFEMNVALRIVHAAIESWHHRRHLRILQTHVGPQPNVLLVDRVVAACKDNSLG